MKQLHKITFLIFINLLLFSCVDSEKDAISIQDLLLGKWQTTVYTENGIIPNNLNDCDLLRTMEFKNDVINYVEYKLDEESNCVFDKIDSYSYQITGSDSFDKIIVDDCHRNRSQ